MVLAVPRTNKQSVYSTWLAKTRAYYDHLLELDAAGKLVKGGPKDLDITRTRPLCDVMIEYVYEIDLDDEVFWVNGIPMFQLECMPTPEVFLQVLGHDHYGHFATKRSTPEKHLYRIAAPTQPPNEDDLVSYESFRLRDTPLSPSSNVNADTLNTTEIHELLGVPKDLSPPERVQTRLYELIIGVLMSHIHFISPLLSARATRATTLNASHPPEYILNTTRVFVSRAFLPMVFHPKIALRVRRLSKEQAEESLLWLHPNVCLSVGFFLDHDDHLRAAVGKVVRDIHAAANQSSPQLKNKGTIYGVLCSLFYCVIIKVSFDSDSGGVSSFQHTSALQFLPSRFAEGPSTPGITALLRLVSRCNDTLYETVLRESPFKAALASTSTHSPESDAQASAECNVAVGVEAEVSSYFHRLPPELVAKIASFVPDLMSLLAFGTLNSTTKTQVNHELSFPFIGNHHLLDIDSTSAVGGERGDPRVDDDEFDGGGTHDDERGLTTGTFLALNAESQPKRLCVHNGGQRRRGGPADGCYPIFTRSTKNNPYLLRAREVD
ncbi:hypothetical protein EYR38_005022 [Pleurotus pulmonarius]|nr:hypothetical protein EYR38_005022 [Pleurotus pulmonarius]